MKKQFLDIFSVAFDCILSPTNSAWPLLWWVGLASFAHRDWNDYQSPGSFYVDDQHYFSHEWLYCFIQVV